MSSALITFVTSVEFATLSLGQDDQPVTHIFKPSDITRLLQREGLAKKEEESGDAMAVDS